MIENRKSGIAFFCTAYYNIVRHRTCRIRKQCCVTTQKEHPNLPRYWMLCLCYFLKIDIFCFFDRLRVFREKGISRKRKIFSFWLKLYVYGLRYLYFQTTYYKNVVSLANIEVFCSAWQFVLQSP